MKFLLQKRALRVDELFSSLGESSARAPLGMSKRADVVSSRRHFPRSLEASVLNC